MKRQVRIPAWGGPMDGATFPLDVDDPARRLGHLRHRGEYRLEKIQRIVERHAGLPHAVVTVTVYRWYHGDPSQTLKIEPPFGIEEDGA
jgi:hypothetical protein